jgi:hypothetical protein
MELVISIRLGNDAMITKNDAWEAISRATREMEGDFESFEVTPPFSKRVRDINGNTVGSMTLMAD